MDNFIRSDPATFYDNTRCTLFRKKNANYGSHPNRINLYEQNSCLHTSLNSGNAERRIGGTPGIVYGLDGN